MRMDTDEEKRAFGVSKRRQIEARQMIPIVAFLIRDISVIRGLRDAKNSDHAWDRLHVHRDVVDLVDVRGPTTLAVHRSLRND